MDHSGDRTTIEIEVIVDNKGSEVKTDLQIEDQPVENAQLPSRSPTRDKDGCFSCRKFSYFAKKCPEDTSSDKVSHREDHMFKQKGCSHLYEDSPDEEEEAMIVMGHNTDTYSSIKVNREDDEYFKQFNL